MRINNIVLLDLMRKRLIAYEDLERVMNVRESSEVHSLEWQSSEIIEKLHSINKYNMAIEEWQKITHSNGDGKIGGEIKQSEEDE